MTQTAMEFSVAVFHIAPAARRQAGSRAAPRWNQRNFGEANISFVPYRTAGMAEPGPLKAMAYGPLHKAESLPSGSSD
jgi:hypothetical protein